MINKLFVILLLSFTFSFQVNAVCGVRITQGIPEVTSRKMSGWVVPADVDLSRPGTVYVLNAGGYLGPLISSMHSVSYNAYYLPGWVRILSNSGPFSMTIKQAAWDSVNGISHETARLNAAVSAPWIVLGTNLQEIKVPIDERFAGKEIGYGLVVNASMTTGMYLKIDDGMCHPSVPVGTQYTFVVNPLVSTGKPPEIRDADGNVLWRASVANANIPFYDSIGQLYYNEVADVRVDISPTSLDFGNVLFDEAKSLPLNIITTSNAVNTKIDLKYEFIDDLGEAVLKVNASGTDGLSDTITSSAVKNGSVTLTRNISITNKNHTAGLYKGYLRVTASIP